MNFLSFNGLSCTEGVSLDVMAKMFKGLPKNATMEDIPGRAILHWSVRAPGEIVVAVDNQIVERHEVGKDKNRVFFLPGNSIVTLRPEGGKPTYLAIANSGDYNQSQSAPPEFPNAPRATDNEEQAAVRAWLKDEQTGKSSRSLSHLLVGLPEELNDVSYPHDPSDFGRCMRFFEVAPGARQRIDEMAKHHPVWAALVPVWGELELLYTKERNQKSAPELYAKMREVIDGAESSMHNTRITRGRSP